MRQLQRPGNSAQAAVRLEDSVQPGDRFVGRLPRRQRKRHIVEAALHVERCSQRALFHPEDAESFLVGHELARADAVDVFGRERDADDPQPPQAPVDDGRDLIPWLKTVRVYETFTGEHFIGPSRLDPAPPPEVQVVDFRSPPGRNRDQPAGCRFVDLRQVERDVRDDARLHGADAGNRRNLVGHSERRALERREHIPESLALVVRALCSTKGFEVRQIHHIHRHARRDDHRDREGLSLHQPGDRVRACD